MKSKFRQGLALLFPPDLVEWIEQEQAFREDPFAEDIQTAYLENLMKGGEKK